MKPDDDVFDKQHSDQELAAALEALQQLPQRVIAQRIGLSERRLRDIERGRSVPRQKTRKAILQLADDMHLTEPTSSTTTCSSDFERISSLTKDLRRTRWSSDGPGQPLSVWAMLGVFGVIIIAVIVLGQAGND